MAVKTDYLQAGRELDAMVSEKVMGVVVCRCVICRDTGPNGICEDCGKPRGKFYSTHADRALALLEHLAANRNLVYRIDRKSGDGGTAMFEITLSTSLQEEAGRGTGPTLALAACRAALTTV